MKQIIVLSGIPGSGKSHLASKIVEKYPENTVIINNDCIRQMLSGRNESNVNETYHLATANKLAELVSFTKETILLAFIGREDIGQIVVDATHFSRKSLKIFDRPKIKQQVIQVLLDVDPDIALSNAQSRVRREDKETIDFVYKNIKAMGRIYDFVLHDSEEIDNFLNIV
jgi:thymidylate kinase